MLPTCNYLFITTKYFWYLFFSVWNDTLWLTEKFRQTRTEILYNISQKPCYVLHYFTSSQVDFWRNLITLQSYPQLYINFWYTVTSIIICHITAILRMLFVLPTWQHLKRINKYGAPADNTGYSWWRKS
jgi:hypothetical protein